MTTFCGIFTCLHSAQKKLIFNHYCPLQQVHLALSKSSFDEPSEKAILRGQTVIVRQFEVILLTMRTNHFHIHTKGFYFFQFFFWKRTFSHIMILFVEFLAPSIHGRFCLTCPLPPGTVPHLELTLGQGGRSRWVCNQDLVGSALLPKPNSASTIYMISSRSMKGSLIPQCLRSITRDHSWALPDMTSINSTSTPKYSKHTHTCACQNTHTYTPIPAPNWPTQFSLVSRGECCS